MEKGIGIMKNETGTIKGTGENQRNRDIEIGMGQSKAGGHELCKIGKIKGKCE